MDFIGQSALLKDQVTQMRGNSELAPDASDVVVVGGGIGGASLAFALARAGVDVSVLEASTEFADRVRGESMQTWGVKEARDIGVDKVLLDAGAHITPVWKQYLEGAGAVGDIPMRAEAHRR